MKRLALLAAFGFIAFDFSAPEVPDLSADTRPPQVFLLRPMTGSVSSACMLREPSVQMSLLDQQFSGSPAPFFLQPA